jgi:hypothetical protein
MASALAVAAVDVGWVFGVSGSFAYVLQSFTPEDAGLGLVGASNPVLTLRGGGRYEVTVTDRDMHPLEIGGLGPVSGADQVLLSMASGVEGSFEADLGTGAIQELRLGFEDRALGCYLRGFGEDRSGELYVLASANLGPGGSGGLVLRLVPERMGPHVLSLLAVRTTLAESGGTLGITIARNLQDHDGELVVALEVTPPGRVMVPATILLAAGQPAGHLVVTAVDNPDPTGDVAVSLTVSANGYDSQSIDLMVEDDDPPPIGALSPGLASGLGTGAAEVPAPVVVAEGLQQAFTVTMADEGPAYRYSWTLNGAVAPGSGDSHVYTFSPGFDAVAHPARSRDSVLACRVTAAAGSLAAATATWQVLRVMDTDRPPAPPQVAIEPAQARTTDDLTAVVLVQPPDPDGDVISGYQVVWDWAEGGSLIAGNPLGHGQTRKGQTWQARVQALTDPYAAGATALSIRRWQHRPSATRCRGL